MQFPDADVGICDSQNLREAGTKDTAIVVKDTSVLLPGGKMHYQTAGRGRAVVLLHSTGSSLWSWSKVMKPLARSHAVYALDIMGQGDSDKPARDFGIGDHADSVVHFMKAGGIGRATVVGNSVGAVIAALIAAATPNQVDKLVLVGCPVRENAREREEATAAASERYDANHIPLPRSLEGLRPRYNRISPQLRKRVNEDLAKAGVEAWKCTLAVGAFDIVPVLNNIEAETLIIYGEHDALRAKEQALKSFVRGSVLAVVPGAGHLPQLDNPKDFLAILKSFL